ncbi:hypothetical protein E1263_25965 [Kribbella antibiotica]|uniref:Uncharacterized protein n=1 Tax=Kribbella antibiotica TaxID=190195 RepID=A0A4R4ZBM8_9ACTN|nr:hypothetical protein [Kribbella antibiotica]TDD55723.1 hypothetical protein E1263_25965 [Kribbella antibiotica]
MNLEDELRTLGRSMEVPPVDSELTAAVLARVAGVPVRRRLRDRWRAFVAGLCVLLAGLALTPPVRATVAEWLRIGGVQAVPGGAAPRSAPPVPSVSGQLSLEEAARVAGFTPALPKDLGAPSAVDASPGFVAMSWGGLRLEQFRSGISPLYLKQHYDALEYIEAVNGYWFSTPHELLLVNTQVLRIAGPTLVWERTGTTFRLEGADKQRATQVAAGTS